MSTIPTLVRLGVLNPIDPALDEDQSVERCIYAMDRPYIWLIQHLPTLATSIDADLTPAQQADNLFAEFCAGEPLDFDGRFKCLFPAENDHGIWELKTPDIRVFGWFYRRDVFMISDVNDATFIKTHNLYGGLRNQAVAARDALDIDPPKYVPGRDPHAVVSNYYCS